MKGGMQKFMQKAQRMQKKLDELKEEFSDREFEASTGGGAVEVRVNGDREVVDLSIDPDAVDPDDVEMLEEMILGAINRASNEANETFTEEMEEITGGMSIPGMP